MNNWHKLSWKDIKEQLASRVNTATKGQLCQAMTEKAAAVIPPTIPYSCSTGYSQRLPDSVAIHQTLSLWTIERYCYLY